MRVGNLAWHDREPTPTHATDHLHPMSMTHTQLTPHRSRSIHSSQTHSTNGFMHGILISVWAWGGCSDDAAASLSYAQPVGHESHTDYFVVSRIGEPCTFPLATIWYTEL